MRGVPGVAGDSRPAARADRRTPIARRGSRSSGRRCRPTGAIRDAFFESLSDVQNRRREPWVLEGLGYLHHPLRAAVVGEVHPPQPRRCCARSSGPATSSSRSDGWTRRSRAQLRERRADGRALPRGAAAGLSRSAPARHPVVGRRPLSRERRQALNVGRGATRLLLAVAATLHVDDSDDTDQNCGQCEHSNTLRSRREASGVPGRAVRMAWRRKLLRSGSLAGRTLAAWAWRGGTGGLARLGQQSVLGDFRFVAPPGDLATVLNPRADMLQTFAGMSRNAETDAHPRPRHRRHVRQAVRRADRTAVLSRTRTSPRCSGAAAAASTSPSKPS